MAVSSNERGALGALAFLIGSCSVGVGSGDIGGSVNVPQCDLASESFTLDVGFYAADDFEEQLTIRLQEGGGYPVDTNGLSIVVRDATAESERLGTPIALTGAETGPVSMSLYLNATCPATPDDLPVFLAAVEGTITFDAIYAPEVDEDQREIRGHFENVRFTDTEPAADEEPRVAILSGDFKFLFERGRPAQPFP